MSIIKLLLSIFNFNFRYVLVIQSYVSRKAAHTSCCKAFLTGIVQPYTNIRFSKCKTHNLYKNAQQTNHSFNNMVYEQSQLRSIGCLSLVQNIGSPIF